MSAPSLLLAAAAPGAHPFIPATPVVGATATKMLAKYPPRLVPDDWPETRASVEEVLRRLGSPPFRPSVKTTWGSRRLGIQMVLRWLETFPGETWQQRWNASPATPGGTGDWAERVLKDLGIEAPKPWERGRITTGRLALICGDVIRPDLASFRDTIASRHFVAAMEQGRDPEGFARLADAVGHDEWSTARAAKARLQIYMIIAAKGGGVWDITVGDCLEQRLSSLKRSAGYKTLAYSWLRKAGVFPADAPATLRFLPSHSGPSTAEQLIDRYEIRCRPVRDLLVDYLRERQAAIDYTSLEDLARHIGKLFWADLEHHHPGIGSLELPPEVAAAWKERLKTITKRVRQPDGTYRDEAVPRMSALATLAAVRMFYLDLAQWAVEEPERWGAWAARCPIKAAEIRYKKHLQQRKERTDRRTRERLPALPVLVRLVDQQLKEARVRLDAVRAAPAGARFTALGETFTKAAHSGFPDPCAVTTAYDGHGRRVDLGIRENRAFWAWAAVEFLRHTGARIEELLEVSHHSIVRYTLPSTGEIVPLLQIAPSKTDQERLLLVTPELADVLSAIVSRVRGADGTVPLVSSYDGLEKIWNPEMPLLFQQESGGQLRGFTDNTVRRYINKAVELGGLTDGQGQPLKYQPHDFRRIFVTDLILNGLPPHIAQVIVGHKDINTTMGYNTVYPAAVIEAHRAFIARRRATRPSEEYRTPTDEEWNEFLGAFERRKLSIGTCGRAFGTDCQHEHACIRCSMLRPDPRDRARLVEIEENLQARIAEAEREGWLGDVEQLNVSLEAARGKIVQLDERTARSRQAIHLGMPTFAQIAGRAND